MKRVGQPMTMTLTEIAALTGISVSTVSKVLNGRGDVAAGTRDKIGRVLREHGYRPASRRGFGVVDLLIGELQSPWAEELVRGSVEAAGRDGRSVVVSLLSTPADLAEWWRTIDARGTDGVLIAAHLASTAELRALAESATPMVVIDPRDEPEHGRFPSVGTTNHQGALVATRHLLELGHRRIAAIGGPASLWSCRARLDGFRAALAEAGIAVDESLIRRDDLTAAGGRRQAAALLAGPTPPTAIAAANDAQALGVLQALGDLGLRAPAEVSVVGFDDVPVATWSAPALTTVHQPLVAMAATAYQMLALDARTGLADTRHVDLATRLVVRESTGPPRTG